MRAEDKSFYFMSVPSYYDIPFFQRAYVWNRDNWSELLSNLTDKNTNHFLGSIILKNELVPAGSVARFSVIDGQQRLTTLSILLRACYDHIEKNAALYGYDTDVIKTCQVKMESLLFVPVGGIKQTLHVKINHSHLDKPAFEKVITGELTKDDKWEKFINLPEDDTTSGIIKAYAYFRSELLDMSQDTINYLWELLTVDKIRFLVNIDLDVTDNEQAIFDTVNSSGVRLSSSDTIKNLLFQKYVELLRANNVSDVDDEAVKEYEATWVDAFISDENMNAYWETERQYGRMKRSNLETFLHSFAVVAGFFNPAENTMVELPAEYRKKISNMNLDELNQFLTDLHDHSEVFKENFSDGNEMLSFDNYVGRLFNICDALEVSTFYPYLLKQLYAREKDQITEEELKAKFFDLEKYIIVNAICKGSTKNYNNECLQLVEGKRTPKDLMESSAYISEVNFSDGLRRMTLNKLPTLILFWVELYDRSINNVDVKSLKFEYTLEHIMPQKWVQNWKDVPTYDKENNVVEDSDEIERVRSHAIYEIGNMTLLNSKLNTSISNSAFLDKINGKNGKKGIKDLADLRLTKAVIDNNNEWDEKKIYARTAKLEETIRKIWDIHDLPVTAAIKSSNVGGVKELRLKFWTMALPIIREKNNNECYADVGPTTFNESYGTYGIGGFKITSVANYDGARVDFMLSKSDKEKNKQAYDILFSHKDEIEEKLGVSLSWDRADDYKSSWTSYSLKGVSIANEDDWEKMAEFLGVWSNKMRTVMVPYLIDTFPPDTSSRRSPEEKEKLVKISEILMEWMTNKKEIIASPNHSTLTWTRFTTETMSELLPDTPGSLGGWNTPNHYFYEIENRTTKFVVIYLSFSAKNLSDEQRAVCDKINDLAPMKRKKIDWSWWKAYKTDKIMIPDDLDKAVIFEKLDEALGKALAFEKELAEKINL